MTHPCDDAPARDNAARVLARRLAARDRTQIAAQLDTSGYASLPALLDPEHCAQLIGLYERSALFRKRIVMAQHGYGRGEYQYFAAPLPEPVQTLRRELYVLLAPIANTWQQRLGQQPAFPEDLAAFEDACALRGQTQPTPLLLRYGPDDENRLHQDLYGELNFPLQAVLLLSEPGRDFTGGELVLTEQRARMQSRVEVIPLARGDAVIFGGALRPVPGARGDSRARVRHGVSRVRLGERFTLGIIFHDAR